MFVYLGISDEVTVCELCGKADLKCTMELSQCDADGNEIAVVRYGRDCGARALGWKVSADRAEKLARGTARMTGERYHAISETNLRADIERKYKGLPAEVEIDGTTIEVFDARYAKLPADAGYTQINMYEPRVYWRVKK